MGEKDRSEKEILEDICGRVNKVHVIPEFDPEFREQYFVDILVDEVVLVDDRPDTFSESFGGRLSLRTIVFSIRRIWIALSKPLRGLDLVVQTLSRWMISLSNLPLRHDNIGVFSSRRWGAT